MATNSKRADREIPEPQIGEAALLPQPEQRPVEGEPKRVVAALDRDPDALAEIAALGDRTADENAAASRIRPVKPESKRNAVTEQQIDLALAQCIARRLHIRMGLELYLGEEGFEIGFVRGAADHRDLLAFDPLRSDVAQRGVAPRHETGRRAVIRIREIDALARLGRD